MPTRPRLISKPRGKPRGKSRGKSRSKSEGEVILDTIDAGYDLAGSERSWLLSMTKAVAPCFDRGLGLVSYFYDASDPAHFKVSDIVGHGATPEAMSMVEPVVYGFTPEQVELSFGGPMIIGTTWEVFGFNPSPPLAAEHHDSPALVREMIDFGFPKAYSNNLEALQAVSSLALRAHQPDGRGIFICSLLPSDGGTTRRFRARWARVSAHLLSAWRLRQRLAKAQERTAPEAILTPSGRLADARFDPSAGQRDVLASAVRRREQARGPLRHSAPDDALSLWQGLVQGRWSLVDQIDRDGKRFVLARRNEAAAPPLAGLTLRERQIVAFALQGLANKLIAYTIGLSVSTVATHLANAAPKLNKAQRQRLGRRGS
jgi:DNA-binding CsgD family transcriptional regulator